MNEVWMLGLPALEVEILWRSMLQMMQLMKYTQLFVFVSIISFFVKQITKSFSLFQYKYVSLKANSLFDWR